MTQFLHLEMGSKDTDCLASPRVGAVLNGSSYVKAVGGWNHPVCEVEWEQPPSEVSALAWLKPHQGA